jgi:hypothetical protein
MVLTAVKGYDILRSLSLIIGGIKMFDPVVCPKCDNSSLSAEFCNKCGTKNIPMPRCGACNVGLWPYMKFCQNCGRSRKDAIAFVKPPGWWERNFPKLFGKKQTSNS